MADRPDTAEPRPVLPAWQRQGRLYVIGIDGISMDIAGPMMERSELPTFRRIAAEGCHGPLATLKPTNSSLLWTSIATGRHFRDHGIDGFQYYSILGWRLSRTTIRKYRRRGIRILEAVAKALRLRKRHHFDGRDIRCKTFWDVVSEAGGRVGVVDWWHSWPASPVNGFVISDRVHYWRAAWRGKGAVDAHLTYPEDLLAEVRELLRPPDDVSAAELQHWIDLPEAEIQGLIDVPTRTRNPVVEVRFLISADGTYARILDCCLEREPETQLVAAYFRGPDIAQHAGYGYLPGSTASPATDEERRAFGGIVPQSYRMADELLGRIVARMGAKDSVLVLSDHGYGPQPGARKAPYGHSKGEPPGALFAMGPEFIAGGRVRDADVYDLFPTALRLMGFPPAQDSEGRCLEELLRPEWTAAHPPLPAIPTYGRRLPRHDTIRLSRETNEKVTEHLKALGYLE
jgi:hypothetical protein